MQKTYICGSVEETIKLGLDIGSKLHGGEVFELVSDLGGGKTTLVRGIVEGFGSSDPVSSPSFTISYVYSRPDGKQFHHFDFYRLDDAGIVGNELSEVEQDSDTVVVVEWGDIVHDLLPKKRIIAKISLIDDVGRKISFEYPSVYSYLFE